MANMPTPTPPTIPAPPIPTEVSPSVRENVPASPNRSSPTRFSTGRSEVRSGAIRIDITYPQQWEAGDVAVIRNQEAKKVRDIGSLIFVRSLLPTEQLEEIDGLLDVDPVSGTRFVRFWVDEVPLHASEDSPSQNRERDIPIGDTNGRDAEKGSPDFGGGVGYQDLLGGNSHDDRERLPHVEKSTPPKMNYPKTPPEDQVSRGCSLHSVEPLREWFCKRADMTSAAEYEASLVQLEEDPPDIRQYNANIREERWTNFSLEGVRFPAMTVDVIQRGEALAVFERDLIIHFQQISKAAALYVRALLGGIKRALEVYRRVDETTKNFPWSQPTTEEKWHSHAEGILMVALNSLNLPTEAWKSARLLRAVPNCRLVLMLSYHMLSPALSVEENGLVAYLQTPPEAGPSITQATSGLQNWKCAGRRLVEIGGMLPTATQLHQSFTRILSKHLAANKKLNFMFQQQSSTIPMMNPSPTEIVDLFVFVEVTLIQYATAAGHFPGVNAASVKPKPKRGQQG